jgi:hypothetical protein
MAISFESGAVFCFCCCTPVRAADSMSRSIDQCLAALFYCAHVLLRSILVGFFLENPLIFVSKDRSCTDVCAQVQLGHMALPQQSAWIRRQVRKKVKKIAARGRCNFESRRDIDFWLLQTEHHPVALYH